MFTRKLMIEALEQSTLNIETLDIENISMCELREMAEEIYNLSDVEERADLMCDYIHTASSPFVIDASIFVLDFSTWIAKSYEEHITEFLFEYQNEYMRDIAQDNKDRI